ncbi:unnamed protein product [Diamesa hyperborea]
MREKEKFIVEYEKELYDITDFMHKHPGGVNTLSGSNNKNIDNKFRSAVHSKAAEYLMKEYRLNSKIDGIKKVNGKPDPHEGIDESMEHLVDWNSAMIPQISQLGANYDEWVNKPVDRPLRLFSNSIMESLSKTPWFLPPIIWIPVIFYLIDYETKTIPIDQYSNLTVFLHLFSGILLWSLVEYTLHRFVFHMNVKKRPVMATFHFLLHGLHHKVPFDENRLVFPPFPAAILAYLFYQPIYLIHLLFSNILSYPILLLAGGMMGYLCYDMIHFYIHYGNPRFTFFYNLKRYHYNHHFVHHDAGFGISSNVWDTVFGTRIILKKLKYLLKW